MDDDELRACALRLLGPASAAFAASPEGSAATRARLAEGATPEDAVLGAVHAAAFADRALADEFMGLVLRDLAGLAREKVSGALGAWVEAVDIQQSVAGDVWRQFGQIAFHSRSEFVALLARRAAWKASDKSRRRASRPADGAESGGDRLADVADQGASGPATLAMDRDELLRHREKLAVVMLRLSEGDRKLLQWHLEQVPVKEIARRRGVAPESVARLMFRAIERAQELWNEGD
jgi:DNA-directed RNA polymerase specialized sigma24 family protein